MVGGTHNTPEGFGEPSGSGNGQQQVPPPPPPLPPSMAQILVTQNELLRQLIHGQQQGGRHHHQPQTARYQDFLGTQPPLFSQTEDPLDADAWARTIESKFSLLTVPCSEVNKARFTAQ